VSGALHGITLSGLAQAVSGTLRGGDCEILGVSTDSRTIAKGDVYFCLSGDKFDGHDYAQAAVAAGAAAIVCERRLQVLEDVTQVVVADTRQAYGKLASLWRATLPVKLIGVTGSNGKTTVKQILREICATAGSVHCTRANDNNDIGVPQTLLAVDESHEFAVVEMGANQLGEIEWLGSIARPNVAIITNVSASHLEGFGSLNAVYREKSAIYTNLVDGGVAIVNVDDRFAGDWLALNKDRSTITFGSNNSADVYVESIEGGRVQIHCQLPGCEGTVDTQCHLAGDHNLMNMAAATAAAIACGIDLADVAKGIANVAPVKGRLNFHHLSNDITLIDDTYNANPASTRAAIEVLATSSAERWLVLGDLKELGADAAAHHVELGEFARRKKVNRLFATGELCRHTVDAFGDDAQWFEDKGQLLQALQHHLDRNACKAETGSRGTAILVKGSRSMVMNDVVDALQNRYASQDVSAAVSVAGGAV